MSFAQNLVDARNSKNISQSSLAAKIPMNQSNYSKIEKGYQEPSLHQLKRICEILEVSADRLLEIDISCANVKRDESFIEKIKVLIKEYHEN